MKKCLCFILTLFFTLTSTNIFAHSPKSLFLIASEMESPALPDTYVRDEFSLMSSSDTLESVFKNAWDNMETTISLIDLKIPASQYQDVCDEYWRILHDNPEYFWPAGGMINKLYGSPMGYIHSMNISYGYTDTNTIAEKKKALDEATAEILLNISDDMTEFEKVMTVHDYMVLNYSYGGNAETQHSIFIMTEKAGVCMGYALAFNHLMNVLGIESTYVSSPKNYMNHAWNLVELDGKWYHIDLTFDDPLNPRGNDMYSYVSHEYALLSTNAIRNADVPHDGFDLGTLEADSTIYDKAPWRNSTGAVVTCNSKHYYVSNNSVMDEDGNIIHENLDVDGNGWNIYKDGIYNYTLSTSYTGLATYGNCIYYNTDKAIYSYDTITKSKTKILTELGVCGIFTDKNFLKYSKYNMSTSNIEYAGEFVAKKEDGPIIGSSIHADGKIITPIYVAEDSHIIVFCHNNVHNQLFHIDGHGSFSVESETGDIFFWTDKLKPLSKKHHVE